LNVAPTILGRTKKRGVLPLLRARMFSEMALVKV
jgi:hypothetical protein